MRARKPFCEWASGLAIIGTPLRRLETDRTSVYLIDERAVKKTELFRLASYFREIFEAELEAVCPDRGLWPPNRTLGRFRQWFTVISQGLVIDLESAPLSRREG